METQFIREFRPKSSQNKRLGYEEREEVMKKLLKKEEEPLFWKLSAYLNLLGEAEGFGAIAEVIST